MDILNSGEKYAGDMRVGEGRSNLSAYSKSTIYASRNERRYETGDGHVTANGLVAVGECAA